LSPQDTKYRVISCKKHLQHLFYKLMYFVCHFTKSKIALLRFIVYKGSDARNTVYKISTYHHIYSIDTHNYLFKYTCDSLLLNGGLCGSLYSLECCLLIATELI